MEHRERIELTEQDLIEALLQAQGTADDPVGMLGTDEIVALTGLKVATVRNRMRELYRAGRLEMRRVRRVRMDGQYYWHPVYRLKAGTGERGTGAGSGAGDGVSGAVRGD